MARLPGTAAASGARLLDWGVGGSDLLGPAAAPLGMPAAPAPPPPACACKAAPPEIRPPAAVVSEPRSIAVLLVRPVPASVKWVAARLDTVHQQDFMWQDRQQDR